MKIKLFGLTIAISIITCACGEPPANSSAQVSPKTSPTLAAQPPATSSSPANKDGDYDGKGVVTKIDTELGSIEMDHEDIPNLMPAMRMEFYVSDRKMLDGLKVGDKVDFVLRYKARTETIVKLSKAK